MSQGRTSCVKRLLLWLPEAIAIICILSSGLFGWSSAQVAAEKRLRSAVLLESARYMDLVERTIVNSSNALQADIQHSGEQEGGGRPVDWQTLTRRVGSNEHLSSLGKMTLAVPVSTNVNRLQSKQQLAFRKIATTPQADPIQFKIVNNEPLNALVSGVRNLASEEMQNSMLRARDTGRAVLHIPRHLATDQGWIYAPVYAIDTPWSVQDRRSQITGVVFAPIDLHGLLLQAATQFPNLSIYWLNQRLGTAGDLDWRESKVAPEPQSGFVASRGILDLPFEFEFYSSPVFQANASGIAPPGFHLFQAGMAACILLMIALYRRWFYQQSLENSAISASMHRAQMQQLERKNADLESFAYVVSHDLRAPLGNLQSLTELLAEDFEYRSEDVADEEDFEECIRRMRDQMNSMDAYISEILDYSSASEMDERIESIDTRQYIESIADTVGVPSDKLKLQGDFPTICTWPVRFEQIMGNLISNAYKYHDKPEQAIIEVCVSGFGAYNLFSVRDNGRGIDPAMHDQIFDVFKAIKVPGVPSSGIGLSIVKSAVESAGGRISLDSTRGAGSVFSFTWPKDISSMEQHKKTR